MIDSMLLKYYGVIVMKHVILKIYFNANVPTMLLAWKQMKGHIHLIREYYYLIWLIGLRTWIVVPLLIQLLLLHAKTRLAFSS